MLQSTRNKATVSILDRLKQKGMPAVASPMPTPIGEEEFQEEPDYNSLDPLAQSLQAPGLRKQDLLKKKKPLPE